MFKHSKKNIIFLKQDEQQISNFDFNLNCFIIKKLNNKNVREKRFLFGPIIFNHYFVLIGGDLIWIVGLNRSSNISKDEHLNQKYIQELHSVVFQLLFCFCCRYEQICKELLLYWNIKVKFEVFFNHKKLKLTSSILLCNIKYIYWQHLEKSLWIPTLHLIYITTEEVFLGLYIHWSCGTPY